MAVLWWSVFLACWQSTLTFMPKKGPQAAILMLSELKVTCLFSEVVTVLAERRSCKERWLTRADTGERVLQKSTGEATPERLSKWRQSLLYPVARPCATCRLSPTTRNHPGVGLWGLANGSEEMGGVIMRPKGGSLLNILVYLCCSKSWSSKKICIQPQIDL